MAESIFSQRSDSGRRVFQRFIVGHLHIIRELGLGLEYFIQSRKQRSEGSFKLLRRTGSQFIIL